MRRTGGTTLATLLGTLSEYAHIEHEPFNWGRVFGHVFRDFKASGDKAQLRRDLAACLADRPLIKHCYELRLDPFNEALMEVTTALGYRHIILDRRNEIDRIMSLELAEITGAWGSDEAKKIYPRIEAGTMTLPPVDVEKVMTEVLLCRDKRLMLTKLLANADPFIVYYEDIYSDPDAGRALIRGIMEYLGIDPAAHPTYDKHVDDALLLRGQNSMRIMDAVPNLNQIKAEMLRVDCAQANVFTPS